MNENMCCICLSDSVTCSLSSAGQTQYTYYELETPSSLSSTSSRAPTTRTTDIDVNDSKMSFQSTFTQLSNQAYQYKQQTEQFVNAMSLSRSLLALSASKLEAYSVEQPLSKFILLRNMLDMAYSELQKEKQMEEEWFNDKWNDLMEDEETSAGPSSAELTPSFPIHSATNNAITTTSIVSVEAVDFDNEEEFDEEDCDMSICSNSTSSLMSMSADDESQHDIDPFLTYPSSLSQLPPTTTMSPADLCPPHWFDPLEDIFSSPAVTSVDDFSDSDTESELITPPQQQRHDEFRVVSHPSHPAYTSIFDDDEDFFEMQGEAGGSREMALFGKL